MVDAITEKECRRILLRIPDALLLEYLLDDKPGDVTLVSVLRDGGTTGFLLESPVFDIVSQGGVVPAVAAVADGELVVEVEPTE